MNVSDLKIGDWVILRGVGLCQVTQAGEKDEDPEEHESGFMLTAEGFRDFIGLSETGDRLRAPVSKEEATRLLAVLTGEKEKESRHGSRWAFNRPEVERILESQSLEEQANYLKAIVSMTSVEPFVREHACHELEKIVFSELAHVLGRPLDTLMKEWRPKATPATPVKSEKEQDDKKATDSIADRIKTLEDFGVKHLGSLVLEDTVLVGDLQSIAKEGEPHNPHPRAPRPGHLIHCEPGEWHIFLSSHDETRMISEEFIACHRNALDNIARIEDDARNIGELKLRSMAAGLVSGSAREDRDLLDKIAAAPVGKIFENRAYQFPIDGNDGRSSIFAAMKNRRAVYIQVVF